MNVTKLLPFERILSLEESNLVKEAIARAVEVFERWGYDYLKLPAFDHYQVLERALGDRSADAITIKDITRGDLVSLRMDFTTQVIRSVMFHKNWRPPLRIYYFGTLYSLSKDTYERFQAGVELIGVKDIEGDAEVICALNDYLRSLGIHDLKVSVGHVGIVRRVLDRVEEDNREMVKVAFKEKNLSLLRSIFGESDLVNLPVTGDGEEALSVLDRLGFEEEREDLRRLGELISSAGVEFSYDLSEVRDYPYYTGVVFEFFTPSVGSPIAGGGRYDKLSGVYGDDFPATGGTIYVDRLLSLLTPVRASKDFFIIDLSEGKRFGFKIASTLRAKGYKVGRDIVSRNEKKSLEHAFSEGYERAVVVLDEERVKVYTTPVEFTPMSLKEFLDLF